MRAMQSDAVRLVDDWDLAANLDGVDCVFPTVKAN